MFSNPEHLYLELSLQKAFRTEDGIRISVLYAPFFCVVVTDESATMIACKLAWLVAESAVEVTVVKSIAHIREE